MERQIFINDVNAHLMTWATSAKEFAVNNEISFIISLGKTPNVGDVIDPQGITGVAYELLEITETKSSSRPGYQFYKAKSKRVRTQKY